MTLNSSGRISIGTSIYSSTNANIEVELGKSGTTQVSLNDTDARALAKITGNNTQIKFSDFRGKMTGSYAISAQTSSGTILTASDPVGYTGSFGATTSAGSTFKVVFTASNYINNKTFYVKYSGSTTSDYTFTSDTLSPSTVTKSTSGDLTTYDFTNTNNAAVSVAMNFTVSSEPMAPFGNGSSAFISQFPSVEWRVASDSGFTNLLGVTAKFQVQRKIISFYAVDSLGTTITSITSGQSMYFNVFNGPVSGKFQVKLPNGSFLPSSTTYYSIDATGRGFESVTLTTPGTGTYTAYFYNSAGTSTGVYVNLTFTVIAPVSVAVSTTYTYVGFPSIVYTISNGPANGWYYTTADNSSVQHYLDSNGSGTFNLATATKLSSFSAYFVFSDNQNYTAATVNIADNTWFYDTPGTVTFTVPANVGHIDIRVTGAGGGGGGVDVGSAGKPLQVGMPGIDGEVVTWVNYSTTPNTLYNVYIGGGGGGGSGNANSSGGGSKGTSGFTSGSGGKGGNAGVTNRSGAGGGGGGSSQFRDSVGNVIIVAGGGGGGGGAGQNGGTPTFGFGASSSTADGANGTSNTGDGGGGGGGGGGWGGGSGGKAGANDTYGYWGNNGSNSPAAGGNVSYSTGAGNHGSGGSDSSTFKNGGAGWGGSVLITYKP